MRGNLEEIRSFCKELTKEKLENEMINDHYNLFASNYADNDDEKRIPYMGWYWRGVDFNNLNITIGTDGSFVGFMENNKWDYRQRNLTDTEALNVIGYLDEAISLSRKGGMLSEIHANTNSKLAELNDYIQSLRV